MSDEPVCFAVCTFCSSLTEHRTVYGVWLCGGVRCANSYRETVFGSSGDHFEHPEDLYQRVSEEMQERDVGILIQRVANAEKAAKCLDIVLSLWRACNDTEVQEAELIREAHRWLTKGTSQRDRP